MAIKKYIKGAPLSDYYQVVDFYGRSKVCFFTDDLEIVSKKVIKGWSFIKTANGFYLEAPEVWLVDIVEPTRVTYFSNNPVNNYAYFLYLKNKSPKALISLLKFLCKNDCLEIFLSKGIALDAEIRAILDDKKVGTKLTLDLYANFLQDKNYKKFLEKSRELLGNVRFLKIERNKSILNYPDKIKGLFLEIKEYYSLINLGNKDLYSHDFVEGLNVQIENMFGFADVFIFVPWGCFKYMGNFITERTVEKVMLWELHMSYYNDHQHKFKNQNLKGKTVLLLDKSYTGGTLNKIANLVKKEGGKPIKVALFPKSRTGIKNSDYIVFLDRILKSKDVDISSDKWYDLLYKKILV